MAEKMGFEHNDEKVNLRPVQKEIEQKIEASEGRVEILSQGFEKVKIESMGGEKDPKYEMDLYVIREKVTPENSAGDSEEFVRIYIGKNELEAKTRQAKGYDERQAYDYDQHDWVEVDKEGGLTVHDWPDGRDYLSKTAKIKGRLNHLVSKLKGKK